MLGQPVSMLVPQVVGFRLTGELPEGATATDLVLTVTQMLRERGVVGKFVEFFGPGLPNLPLADRATIGNMSPEMGATCAIFPVDAETLRYLEFSGRPPERVELVEAYCREQGLFHDEDSEEADLLATRSSSTWATWSRRWPARSARRTAWRSRTRPRTSAPSSRSTRATDVAHGLRRGASTSRSRRATRPPTTAAASRRRSATATRSPAPRWPSARRASATASVVIAAITSCTNTSNPSVMLGAGLLAKKAVEAGLERDAVGEDLARAGLEGRDRVPRARRPDRAASTARLRPRRLRLHHLHRELGPAAGGRSRRRSRSATWSVARCCPATATSRAASTPR